MQVKKYIRHLGSFVFVLVFFTTGILLAAYLTGRTPRAYSVLPPDQILHIAGEESSVATWAERYAPQLHLRPETPSPPLLGIWYEAIPTDQGLDFVYHFNWEDEKAPHKTVNALYAVFRAAYFGYPLRDVEYFQVGVNVETGNVDRLLVETSRTAKFDTDIVEHIVLEAERSSENVFWVEKREKGGKLVEQYEGEQLFEGRHVQAGVATWNHLSNLLSSESQSEYSIRQTAALAPLDEATYKGYKFARKSQGGHNSSEPLSGKIFAGVIVLFSFIFPIVLIRWSRRRKRSASEQLR